MKRVTFEICKVGLNTAAKLITPKGFGATKIFQKAENAARRYNDVFLGSRPFDIDMKEVERLRNNPDELQRIMDSFPERHEKWKGKQEKRIRRVAALLRRKGLV